MGSFGFWGVFGIKDLTQRERRDRGNSLTRIVQIARIAQIVLFHAEKPNEHGAFGRAGSGGIEKGNETEERNLAV